MPFQCTESEYNDTNARVPASQPISLPREKGKNTKYIGVVAEGQAGASSAGHPSDGPKYKWRLLIGADRCRVPRNSYLVLVPLQHKGACACAVSVSLSVPVRLS